MAEVIMQGNDTVGRRELVMVLAMLMAPAANSCGAEQILTPRLHYLRSQASPEWSDFPRQPEGRRLELRFQAGPNSTEWTMRLRQQDVRQTWVVRLNGKELGRLL